MDVSVIIPAYNRLWALPSAIESCRNAACQVEIIVIDDGSTDGTAEWLKTQFGLIILSQPNLGKCSAVNKGFAICKGKYVKFLDSDDSIMPRTLDEQFELAEANNSDIVVSGYLLVDDKGRAIRQQQWVDCDDYIAQQLGECDSSHYSAYLFKRSLIEDIPHRGDFAYRDDRLFVLETALKSPKVTVHNGLALMHTAHQKPRMQQTSGTQKTLQNYQHVNIYKKIFADLQTRNQLTHRRIKASQNVLWTLCKWIARDNLRDAENLLKWIIQLDPDFKIPVEHQIDKIYRLLGFRMTERLLTIKRSIF